MNNTIDTRDLTRKFGSFTAVDRISISVSKGEIFGFLGPNGAGKTTAIRMLCGLLQPTSGSGHVAGFDIIKQTSRIRSRIGYMSQKFTLYTDLKVKENLKLYGTLYGLSPADLHTRTEWSSEFLGLGPLLDRRTGDLPWGWQQRLSLACANLHEPALLFLDEPTGSVDPVSRMNFWDLIQQLSGKGTTVFVSTHHMDEAEYCHRLSLMLDGRIISIDSPAAIKETWDSESLHQAFLRAVEYHRDHPENIDHD